MGAAATVRPLKVGNISGVDFGVLIGASFLLLLFGLLIGKRTITRGEGGIMAAIYIAYTVYLVAMC